MKLYIGKMGAGCDCNYFMGMIDSVSISNQEHSLDWEFLEGEGSATNDESNQYQGEIIGASWVMPDGTIVAQAIQLFSDEPLFDISGQAGDQLLFFIEIEEYTRICTLMLTWNIGIMMVGTITILMPILLTIIYQTLGNMMILEKIIMTTCGWIICGRKRAYYGW